MMTSWQPDTNLQQQISDFVDDWFAVTPEVLGIDETISGCQVVHLDPFGVGANTLPRYIRVALRDQYYQEVFYRGGIPGLAVTDYVTVAHLREGNRYEVTGPGGSSGSIISPLSPAPASLMFAWMGV